MAQTVQKKYDFDRVVRLVLTVISVGVGVWLVNYLSPVLMPFVGLIEAQTQPEMYRSMLMNVFLFVPFGLSMPHILPEKTPSKVPDGPRTKAATAAATSLTAVRRTTPAVMSLTRN